MLNFREIEVFWATYRSGSIKKAARALNVSQPAVSMMLRNAEQRFGVRLFERSAGKVEPTAEARALATIAERVFRELADLETLVGEMRRVSVGSLRVAAAPSFATALLPAVVASLRKKYPAIHVTLRMVPTKQVMELAADKEIDLGIGYGPVTDSLLRGDLLWESRICCVMRADHPLASREIVDVDDLAGMNVITYRSDTPPGTLLEASLQREGKKLDVAIHTTAPGAAALAESGQGVAIIDPFVLNGTGQGNLVLRPFRPLTIAPALMIMHAGTKPNKTIQVFRSEIIAAARAASGIAEIRIPEAQDA
jgi:DNA-binding transcriptional LysR family regulator